MIKIIEKFVKKVVTARPEDSLAAVARSMEQHNTGAVVITENHRPVGIITDRDLALELGAHGTPPQTHVVQVMKSPVETIGRDEGVFSATQSMKENQVRRLPAVDEDGRLVGIVTLDDVLRVMSRELSNVMEGIKPEMAVEGMGETFPVI